MSQKCTLIHLLFLGIFCTSRHVLSMTNHRLRKSLSDKQAHELDRNRSQPNIVVILADDLGYGDLSLKPFNAMGIKTPEIELLAQQGFVMTKY